MGKGAPISQKGKLRFRGWNLNPGLMGFTHQYQIAFCFLLVGVSQAQLVRGAVHLAKPLTDPSLGVPSQSHQ